MIHQHALSVVGARVQRVGQIAAGGRPGFLKGGRVTEVVSHLKGFAEDS